MNLRTYRTLKAHGSVSEGTEYEVRIAESKAVQGKDCLFSFNTPTDFHGSYTVEIFVKTGELVIESWTATYPAMFNGISGYAIFKQPIISPMIVLENNYLKEYSSINIKSGNSFRYEHMMFNGPTKFLINAESYIEENDTVYVGDLITKCYSPGIIKVTPEYLYDHRPNNLKEHDLNLLKEIVLRKIMYP